MRRIWAPTGKLDWGKDFQWMSVAEFHQSFSIRKALAFLGQIKKTLQKEAKELLSRGGYYYTGIRHVFAEIDGLGKLYRGERGKGDTAKHAIVFGTEYLGRVNPRYKDLFGLLFDMWRHGLAHTHLTKSVLFRDDRNRLVVLGWIIAHEQRYRHRHLTVGRRDDQFYHLLLHVPRLVEDTLRAINQYASDLRKAGERSRLFARFKQGYIGTAAVFPEPLPHSPPTASAVKPPKPKGPAKAKKHIKRKPLFMNPYSVLGIQWVRNQISSRNVWMEG